MRSGPRLSFEIAQEIRSRRGAPTRVLAVEFDVSRVTINNILSGKSRVVPYLGNHRRHGESGSKLHRTWVEMRRRCRDKAHHDYPNYGGRGITVCTRWETYENFAADMGPRPSGRTLGRINNDGNYEPSNCRWETHKEQASNRRPARRRM